MAPPRKRLLQRAFAIFLICVGVSVAAGWFLWLIPKINRQDPLWQERFSAKAKWTQVQKAIRRYALAWKNAAAERKTRRWEIAWQPVEGAKWLRDTNPQKQQWLEGAAPMCDPGYYSTNSRALSLSELVRMRGWLCLPLTYLISRFKNPTSATWMPQMWADLECAERELSPGFVRAATACRASLRNLGFDEVGFKKLKRVLNPNHRDDGGINFLDRTHSHYGQLIYNKVT